MEARIVLKILVYNLHSRSPKPKDIRDELRTRRQDRERHERETEQRQQEDAAAAQAEAEEIAEAIGQIEEFERQESIRLAEEERRRQIEEELILARLEEERLLAEIARREAEEEAERQLLEILLHSSKEELGSMADKLQQIINFQRAALSSTHMRRERAITNEQQARMLEITKENNRLSAWLDQNVRRRQEALHNRHNQEREQMIQQVEQEEDDLFMEMTMYLRDKPNRAQRESKMRETFQKQQQDKQEQLINKHKQERDKLAMGTEHEYEGLRKSVQTKMEPIEIRSKATLRTLGNQIGCDRRWFEVISERRVQMLTKHELIVIEQVGTGQEPIGLTEDVASGLQPLPRIDDTDDEDDGRPESSGSRYGFVDSNATPAQLPPQVVETEDLYGASQDFFELSGSSSFRPTTTSATTNASPPLSRNSRSETVSDRIPGAFPPSEAGPSKTPTLPRNASKHHSSTIPKSAAMSMYGVMAMSFVVPEPRDSLQRSLSNMQSQGVASLADSSQRLSATTTAASTSISRPSSITTDTTSFDTVLTAQVSGSSKEDTLKAKKSFFGRLGRRKELSEDEIRQRMVRCVGDGMGS
ncbi:hypothetical protein LTR05_007167 [Lithohypha guttulata]|uniref:Uncharacterized protein n=1 Tax=Lithohypha guttulata TaxID=1690604 RepID=A0AAN7Y4F9_9EURO|nr:hypothetical protein LTR05_007167 [Lithohypha guttulata]